MSNIRCICCFVGCAPLYFLMKALTHWSVFVRACCILVLCPFFGMLILLRALRLVCISVDSFADPSLRSCPADVGAIDGPWANCSTSVRPLVLAEWIISPIPPPISAAGSMASVCAVVSPVLAFMFLIFAVASAACSAVLMPGVITSCCCAMFPAGVVLGDPIASILLSPEASRSLVARW